LINLKMVLARELVCHFSLSNRETCYLILLFLLLISWNFYSTLTLVIWLQLEEINPSPMLLWFVVS
jgi:hypothetical protein